MINKVSAVIFALLCCSQLTGCPFATAAAAGFVGTVFGNLGSDTIEGKWYPGKPVKEEKKDD